MTVIDCSLKSIARNTNEVVKYLEIPHNDPYVYADISKGKTYGVFQLESPGMRGFMSELYSDVDLRIKLLEKKYKVKGFKNPKGSGNKKDFIKEMSNLGQELFERLIAGISLYRPGPMDYIPDYVAGMENPESIIYDTPELEPILKATYGQIVYQEQVMQVVQKLGGYSLGRADLVRRAMGKKKADIMAQEKEIFINGKIKDDGTIEVPGCIRNGISKEIAEKVWHKMEDFCKYAFNKSHSAGYAVISIITAWLKYYYPIDFMASTINAFIDKSDKLKSYLSVCKDMGIKILPPHVNNSLELFSRSCNDIIFGLKGIKNMGKTTNLIMQEVTERGKFLNYQDFAVRMAKYQKINKKVLEALIYSGAADCFEGSRRAKLEILELILKSASREKDEYEKGQITIFDVMPEESHLKEIKVPNIKEFEKRYKLEKEKEFAGFYVTEHPMDEYEKYLKKENITKVGFLVNEDDELNEENENIISQNFNGMKIKIAGIIRDMKMFYTKKDSKPLYVFNVEDRSGELECVIFSDKIEANQDKLIEGKMVLIKGTIKDDDRGIQLIVKSVVDIEALERKNNNPKVLKVIAKEGNQLNKFNSEILKKDKYKGNVQVYASLNGKTFKADEKININLAIINKLESIFGNDNYEII